MIKLLRDIASYIRESVKGTDGYISHTKISSYFILGGIITSIIIFSTVDIMNAIISWQIGNVYTIPYEHIFIYSLTLTHHLILLGLKKGSDSDYLKYSVKNNELKYNSMAQAQIQQEYERDNGYGYGSGNQNNNNGNNNHKNNRNNHNHNNNNNNYGNNNGNQNNNGNGRDDYRNNNNRANFINNANNAFDNTGYNNPDDQEARSSNFGGEYDGM